MGKSTISMAIFNSYFDITRGYILLNPMKNPIKPPFSYGFPMVFLWLCRKLRQEFTCPVSKALAFEPCCLSSGTLVSWRSWTCLDLEMTCLDLEMTGKIWKISRKSLTDKSSWRISVKDSAMLDLRYVFFLVEHYRG